MTTNNCTTYNKNLENHLFHSIKTAKHKPISAKHTFHNLLLSQKRKNRLQMLPFSARALALCF